MSNPTKLKPGQRVGVFCDPVSRKMLEDVVTIVSVPENASALEELTFCMVRFEDGEVLGRMVCAENILGNTERKGGKR